MTTYGRLVIRTGDAIITIVGRDMTATVTGCDGSTPLQGFSITEGSHAGTSKTPERDDYIELGSPRVGESCSTVDHQLLASKDSMRSISVSEEIPSHCQSRPTVNVDDLQTSDSHPNDVGLATDKCGSLDNSESEQSGATPSNQTSSDEEYFPDGGHDSDDIDSECAVFSSVSSNKRSYQEVGDGEESEQSLVVQKSIRSSASGERSIATDSSSANSGLQSQSTEKQHPLKKKRRITPSHGKKSYLCDTCGKTYSTSSNLSQHVRIHTGEKPYTCDTCGKTYTTLRNLSQHVRIHSGERPYSCNTCGKTFAQNGGLVQHIRVHTGERPYSCATCGKTFTQSGKLSQHVRVHTGERPYKCGTCGKTFTQSGYLSQHLRVHTGERTCLCDTCGKTFTQHADLYRHVRVHTGERPYSCDTCGETFITSGHLSTHAHIHTRKKP